MIESSKYRNLEKYFRLYHSIRLHFSSNYDFFKYRGKTGKFGNLDKKRGKNFIFRLEKKYGDEFANFLVCMFTYHDKNDWRLDQFIGVENEKIYDHWKSKMTSLPYYFEQDLNFLKDLNVPFNDMFKCTVIKNGVKSKSHPLILKHYIKEDINLETLIVIDIVLGYFQHWDKSMENDFMWKDLHFKIKKYKPFLTISKERYKKILKKVFV
jgi:hypothetical protein|tara:strand:+ start:107 stop:736 length:630 start_codon:yes stop_codon:yes gene_type:complete